MLERLNWPDAAHIYELRPHSSESGMWIGCINLDHLPTDREDQLRRLHMCGIHTDNGKSYGVAIGLDTDVGEEQDPEAVQAHITFVVEKPRTWSEARSSRWSHDDPEDRRFYRFG